MHPLHACTCTEGASAVAPSRSWLSGRRLRERHATHIRDSVVLKNVVDDAPQVNHLRARTRVGAARVHSWMRECAGAATWSGACMRCRTCRCGHTGQAGDMLHLRGEASITPPPILLCTREPTRSPPAGFPPTTAVWPAPLLS